LALLALLDGKPSGLPLRGLERDDWRRTCAFGFQLAAGLASRRTVERGAFEKSHKTSVSARIRSRRSRTKIGREMIRHVGMAEKVGPLLQLAQLLEELGVNVADHRFHRPRFLTELTVL